MPQQIATFIAIGLSMLLSGINGFGIVGTVLIAFVLVPIAILVSGLFRNSPADRGTTDRAEPAPKEARKPGVGWPYLLDAECIAQLALYGYSAENLQGRWLISGSDGKTHNPRTTYELQKLLATVEREALSHGKRGASDA